MTLHASLAGNVVLAAIIFSYGVSRTLDWLTELEAGKGKHRAPSMQVKSDYDQQTIEVFRTMNNPPAQFFEDGQPDWADELETWTFDKSSIAALRARLDIDAQVKQFRAELFGEKDSDQAA